MSAYKRAAWYSLSAIGGPLVSFATLPLYTMKLGPEQYGVFAVGTAFAGLISGVAGSVSTLNLPTQLNHLQGDERKRYLAVALLISLAVALGLSLLIFVVMSQYRDLMGDDSLRGSALLLSVTAGMLNSPWAVMVEILTIDGRARMYSLLFLSQIFVNVVVVSISLFLFGLVQQSLLLGFTAAALFNAVSSLLWLAKNIQFSEISKFLRIAGYGGYSAFGASLSENARITFERSYLAAFDGVSILGLYAHAQYYKNASMSLINALSRGVLPTALEEAKSDIPDFKKTNSVWRLVQLFVVAACVGMALFGKEIIGFLTHNKFIGAAPYAVAMLIILLCQTAAKPHSILLLATGRGKLYANLNILTTAIAIGLLLIMVPIWGVWGAICAILAQTLIQKTAIYVYSREIRKIGFTDILVLLGIFCSVSTEYLVNLFKPDIEKKLILVGIIILLLLSSSRGIRGLLNE